MSQNFNTQSYHSRSKRGFNCFSKRNGVVRPRDCDDILDSLRCDHTGSYAVLTEQMQFTFKNMQWMVRVTEVCQIISAFQWNIFVMSNIFQSWPPHRQELRSEETKSQESALDREKNSQLQQRQQQRQRGSSQQRVLCWRVNISTCGLAGGWRWAVRHRVREAVRGQDWRGLCWCHRNQMSGNTIKLFQIIINNSVIFVAWILTLFFVDNSLFGLILRQYFVMIYWCIVTFHWQSSK